MHLTVIKRHCSSEERELLLGLEPELGPEPELDSEEQSSSSPWLEPFELELDPL